MARITVEDCLENISNRFALVLIAAKRSKEIMEGDTPFVQDDRGNKEIVTSLREVAGGFVGADESKFEKNIQLMMSEVESKAKNIGFEGLPPEA